MKKGILSTFLVYILVSLGASGGELLHFQNEVVSPKDYKFHFVIPSVGLEQERGYVIQFDHPILKSEMERLNKNNIFVKYYLPDDALIVKSDFSTLNQLLQEKFISSVTPLLGKWKVSEGFKPISVFNANDRLQVQVEVFDLESARTFKNHLQSLDDVYVLSESLDQFQIELTNSQLFQLKSRNEIVWIQPIVKMVPQVLNLNLDFYGFNKSSTLTGFESGTKIMKFENAWNKGWTGKGIIVGMADTGLDSGNPSTIIEDMRGQVIKGYRFGLGSQDWRDPMGHGTHVAGSVMSNGSLSQGQIRGGAYEAQMIPQGMWSPIIDNLTVPPKLKSLFEPVYADGGRIHTNSWGGGQIPGGYDSNASQVDDFIWNHPDMLIIFAAGNNGVDKNKDGRIDENSMVTPGSAKNVLTVGASENLLLEGGIQRKLGELLNGEPWGVEPLASDLISNNPDGLAPFSSRGPTKDGRIKPDVVAPGTNIVSNCSQVEGANPLWGKYNDFYCYSGGTSMSTPLVAGAAAVVRQFLNQEWSMSEPSAALLKSILMHTADDLYPGQYGTGRGQELMTKAPNNHEGYGRVNVDKATSSKNENYFVSLIDEKNGISTGEKYLKNIELESGNYKVTLVYSDAPAAPNAARTLVNNIDLMVSSSNVVLARSESSIDNIEQAKFNLNQKSNVQVEVLGKNVPKGKNGKQPFAMVISKD